MIETVFLAPVRFNDGRLVPRRTRQALEARLIAAFGGFSRLDGVLGAWQAADRVYHDVSRQYTVALTSWGQLSTWLALIDWVRAAHGQEAVYIRVAGIPEIWTG